MNLCVSHTCALACARTCMLPCVLAHCAPCCARVTYVSSICLCLFRCVPSCFVTVWCGVSQAWFGVVSPFWVWICMSHIWSLNMCFYVCMSYVYVACFLLGSVSLFDLGFVAGYCVFLFPGFCKTCSCKTCSLVGPSPAQTQLLNWKFWFLLLFLLLSYVVPVSYYLLCVPTFYIFILMLITPGENFTSSTTAMSA